MSEADMADDVWLSRPTQEHPFTFCTASNTLRSSASGFASTCLTISTGARR